ncbi:MAG: flagellar biosynthesis anti-sigma factor FlgM [Eubacteriales bacterium]
MKITSSMLGAVAPNTLQTGTSKVKKDAVCDPTFDQFTRAESNKLSGEGRDIQEATAKLSQEVRAHNSTGKIAEIKAQVQNGTYVADARETATRMMLLGVVE